MVGPDGEPVLVMPLVGLVGVGVVVVVVVVVIGLVVVVVVVIGVVVVAVVKTVAGFPSDEEGGRTEAVREEELTH